MLHCSKNLGKSHNPRILDVNPRLQYKLIVRDTILQTWIPGKTIISYNR